MEADAPGAMGLQAPLRYFWPCRRPDEPSALAQHWRASYQDNSDKR